MTLIFLHSGIMAGDSFCKGLEISRIYNHNIVIIINLASFFVGHRQAAQTQIRRRRNRRLISAFTVCLQNFLFECEQDKFDELISPTKGYLRETCKSQNINPIYLTLSSPSVLFRSYRCEADCRSRGREFDPGPVPYFRGD